jgi:hypothetical protein
MAGVAGRQRQHNTKGPKHTLLLSYTKLNTNRTTQRKNKENVTKNQTGYT